MNDPILSLVVAVAENGVIGRDGAMPWRQPTDLKRFRALTTGAPIVVGRKTFQSIGRPLPDRTNIVVSRSGWEPGDTVHLAHELGVALDLALSIARRDGLEEAFVIGGSEIYAAALPRIARAHVTRIHASPDGDAYFPELGPEWRERSRERVEPGAKDDHPMSFLVLERA